MAGSVVLITIDPSGVRRCRARRQRQRRRQCAPAESDRLAPARSAKWPAVPRHPLRDAEICGAEVSFSSCLPRISALTAREFTEAIDEANINSLLPQPRGRISLEPARTP